MPIPRKISYIVPVMPLLVLIAGCDEGPGAGPGASATEGQLRHWSKPEQIRTLISTPLTLSSFGSSLLPSTASSYVPTLPVSADSQSQSTQQQVSTCVSASPEDPTDSDQDGFPSLLEIVADCSLSGVVFRGRMTVRDTDDADPSSPVELKYNDLQFDVGEVSARIDGTLQFTPQSASTTNYQIDASLSVVTRGIQFEAVYDDYSITLDGSILGSGTVDIDGGLALSWNTDCASEDQYRDLCEAQVELLGGPQGSLRVHVNTEDLAFAIDCATTFFTRGEIALRDEVGNVARTRFDGCGTWATTYSAT